ncbi:MAG TPA: class I SAM-dependent methyltransferase [Chitinophagaceae bacterium]|nr:class I SAM-dependent methyltransferase [Chitinophagaceae bacterium]
MDDEKFSMMENRLTKVNRHISRQAKRMGVSCYRIYDHDLPEFPICIDRYEDFIHIAEYKRRHGMDESSHERWVKAVMDLVSRLLEIPASRVFFKERKRKSSRLDQYGKMGSQSALTLVRESGLKFRVNLSDYLDTGLFLDHRITRSLVREEARDKKVLNLFCYTGSFSVYAASGGARRVDSVDLSNTYLSWARENLELNGLLDSDRHRLIRADVLRYLPGLEDGSYDLIILDPPTFSNSKAMTRSMDIQQDHVDLILGCLRLLSPGGWIYFSTNLSDFMMNREALPGTVISDITDATIPFDFERSIPHHCFRIRKH